MEKATKEKILHNLTEIEFLLFDYLDKTNDTQFEEFRKQTREIIENLYKTLKGEKK